MFTPIPRRASVGARRLLLSTAVFLAAAMAQGTPGFNVWDGGSGNWDTEYLNWDGGHKWNNNSNALLGGTAGTLSLPGTIHAKILRFSSTGYQVSGPGTLTIKDGILLDAGVAAATVLAPVTLTGSQTWNVTDSGALLTVSDVGFSGKALRIEGPGDVTLAGGLTGLGSLTKAGTGTLRLTGTLGHVGATTVTDGVLEVTGAVTVSTVTVGGEGALTGNGTLGDVVVALGGILSPGLSVGTLTAGDVSWQGGGYYNWQIADADGPAGIGHDQLVSDGTLTVEATSTNRFKVNLWSLAGLVGGEPANFDPGAAYAWDIATFASVVGFDAGSFVIVRGPSEGTGGFLPEAGGAFSLSSDGERLTLHYTPDAEPVWIDSTGDWSDGTRWLGGSPPAEDSAIVFAGTGGVSTNDDHLSSVASLRFSAEAAGAYVVDGAALVLGAGGIINESAFVQTVATDLTLSADSLLMTHSETLVVSGDIATAGHSLVVDGDHDTEISGVISGTGAVHKLDSGRLTLSGDNTYLGGTEVVLGELIVDGAIVGPTVVRQLGVLGGVGSLSGDVSLAGTLAPGASPGILTQATGDTTLLAGARLVAELGGVTPGTGDGFHDRYEIADGRCLIQPGVTLEVRGWEDALGADFLPGRGDVFTVIRASGGITGAFADLANPDRPGRILLDNASDPSRLFANLYGTGLTGDQTLAAYATNASQAAFAGALDRAAISASPSSTAAHPAGFIDGAATGGRVVLAVLAGEDLDAYSPEPYLGATDYALSALRAAADGALASRARPPAGTWSFGFSQGHLGSTLSGGSSSDHDSRLSATNTLVTAACETGPTTTLGFFIGLNDGHLSTRHGRLELDGAFHGVTLVQRLPTARPAAIRACLAWADLDLGSSRRMSLGESGDGEILLSSATSSAQAAPLEARVAQVTGEIQLTRSPSHELTALVGLVHGRSTLAAFTETGSGANLSVAVQPRDLARAHLGLGLSYAPAPATSIIVTALIEHELGESAARLEAGLDDETFGVSQSRDARTTGMLALALEQGLGAGTSLRLGAEARFNSDTRADRRFNLSVVTRF